jgi:hypothetical protein
MQRYFFDIRNNGDLSLDEEGLEFPSQRAAEIEAARSLADMAREMAPADDLSGIAIEVRAEAGPLFKVALLFERARRAKR